MIRPARVTVLAAHAVLGGAAVACEAIGGIETYVYAPPDAADASRRVGGDASPQPEVPQASHGCPTGRGPAMIRIGELCIDATEVTQADYAEFVRAADPAGQPEICAWNESFVPGDGPTVKPVYCEASPTAPQGCVDWCDAFMFCAWSGKRLCSTSGGVARDLGRTDDPANEWYAACSASGARAFPYGSTYEPTACNGLDQNRGSLVTAGALEKCQGSAPGLFDMSGNVWEWEDACAASDGGTSAAEVACRFRGGSVTDDASQLRCDALGSQPRAFQQYNVGFRCCATAR